jgi:ABC-2 type transport system ATP-binding protein
MHAIEAIGLVKRFKGTTAVDHVDLVVDDGDTVGLLGPNGAGKTTTIMMLLGITEPDEGSVTLLGHPLPRERTRALEQSNFTASYVGMPDRMKVREILSVFAGIYGAPRDRIDEVMDLFDLHPLAKRTTSELSSGQRTLLGLAKSLLNRPRLLFLDEPTASLDPAVAHEIREILLRVHREERFTLFITSHNMSDIERLCRRVIFLGGGRIVADGAPIEIVERYGAEDLEGTFLSIATEVSS